MTSIMRTLAIALGATLALSLAPPLAAAEYLVPEGNSAVSQYTEGVPTAGGEKGKKPGTEQKPVTPAKTIGAQNAKKLQEQGPEGEAAAELAAETAPPSSAPERSGAATGHKGPKHAPAREEGHPEGGESTSEGRSTPPPTEPGDTGSGGSSGLGSVLAAATGSESGNLGVLLPLAILAAIAWGVGYALKQRKRPAPR
jgi:hypothetical protein